MLDILVERARGDRQVWVLFPPNAKEVGDSLPTSVALFGLGDPLDRILASECKQRIANPAAPLLEASECPARLDRPVQPTPTSNGQKRRQQLSPPSFHFLLDVDGELARFRILSARVQLNHHKTARQIFR